MTIVAKKLGLLFLGRLDADWHQRLVAFGSRSSARFFDYLRLRLGIPRRTPRSSD